MQDNWKYNIARQLKKRNHSSKTLEELIQTTNSLRISEKGHRHENQRLQLANQVLQAKIQELQGQLKTSGGGSTDPLGQDVKGGQGGQASLSPDETIRQLQAELASSYRQYTNQTKQLLSYNEQIRNDETRYQKQVDALEVAHMQIFTCKTTIQELTAELEGKDKTVHILKEELHALQITLLKEEEKVKTLQKENKLLYNRVMKKIQEDVLNLNESAIVEKPPPLPPIPSSSPMEVNRLSKRESAPFKASLLFLEGPVRGGYIGASVVPKISKRTFQAHQGEINSIQFSLTGNHFVTGGSEKVLKVWDGYSLESKAILQGSEKMIMHVTFSPNDEFVSAASTDNACRIWSLATQKVRNCFLGHMSKVNCAQFSPHNDKVITGSHDKTLRVWDIAKRCCVRTIFCLSSCNDLCLTRDASVAISGHHDHKLRFWDLKTGECFRVLDDVHTGQITGVAMSPDGTVILTNSRDNTLKIIGVITYEIEKTFRHEDYRNVLNWTRACWSPDGRYVAAGSADGTIFVWNVLTGLIEQVLKGNLHSTVTQVAWHPVGHQLASVDRSGWVSFWG